MPERELRGGQPFGAVLTLPGMAGVVLTIGMAVDSNILIFECIREELRAGKSASTALAAGFSKAFATLVDAHVTTVVSCFFLFLFGTPSVKEFATTLVIGLITNLLTSVFVSRLGIGQARANCKVEPRHVRITLPGFTRKSGARPFSK